MALLMPFFMERQPGVRNNPTRSASPKMQDHPMSQAIKELTSPCNASKGGNTTDKHLAEACRIFAGCVTEFGRKMSALDALFPEEDAEDLRASARQLRAEWRSIAWSIIETPAHHAAGRQAKVDALSAYFLHVDDAIECIALDLARSLIADLKSPGDQ